MYKYSAKLIKLVDGDTVDLLVDLGFHIQTKIRFRLANIDAPERGQLGYTQTNSRLAELISDTEILVESIKTEKYGRWLGVLYVNDININNVLLNENLAKEYKG
jgi:micrococcal nuclease